jgi:hypothetical protein
MGTEYVEAPAWLVTNGKQVDVTALFIAQKICFKVPQNVEHVPLTLKEPREHLNDMQD